jgi:rare lipoprotein A
MWKLISAVVAALVICGCAVGPAGAPEAAKAAPTKFWQPLLAYTAAPAKVFSGVASWYGPRFHGRLTANGEIYNQNALTAAHRSLPFGTIVRVTNLTNNVQTIVRINDRGPYVGDRLIDLSHAAARAVNMVGAGVAKVKLDILG